MKKSEIREMIREETQNINEETKIQKIMKVWGQIAKEKLKSHNIDETYACFGSELATLRLYSHYASKGARLKSIRYGYSSNYKKYFFSMDL